MTDRRYVLRLLRLFGSNRLYLTTQSTVVFKNTTSNNIENVTTQCINVFRVILTINTNYLPKQHSPVDLSNEEWLCCL